VPRHGRGPGTAARGVPVLAPVAALVAICAVDAVLAARSWSVPVTGLLDEPAHLLTAWLVLAALGLAGLGGRPSPVLPWALVGSVALDVDHIPLYLWSEPVAAPGSRPVTHSAVTVAVLLLLAVLRTRARTAALGLAAGVALHLVRDVVSGPGIPLLWPLSPANAELPYAVYLAVLLLAAALAVRRAWPPTISAASGP
jgi:inner membrane protein